MNVPTADEMRARSQLLAAAYPASGPNDTALDAWADDAAAIVRSITARKIVRGDIAVAPIGGDNGIPVEEVPPELHELGLKVVSMKAEALWEAEGTARARRKRLRNYNLKSIAAGPWNESYFGPEEIKKAKVLDPDPNMHERLWALATEPMRDEWYFIWHDEHRPAGTVQPFGNLRQPGSYGRDGWGSDWTGVLGPGPNRY